MAGQYVVLGMEDRRVAVLDPTDPATPVLLGESEPLPAAPSAIVVSDTLAYIAAGEAGLCIVDLSDPARPLQVSCHTTPRPARAVALEGPYAYVLHGGLSLLDISDPAHPCELGQIGESNEYDATDVAVRDRRLFVTTIRIVGRQLEEGGLAIWDVADPAHPVLLSTLLLEYNGAHKIALKDDLAVIGCSPDLHVVDVSDPANPRSLGYTTVDYGMSQIIIRGNVVYLAAHALYILDLTDPANPTVAGSYSTESYLRTMAVSGSRAYLVVGNPSALSILDIREPAHPLELCRMGSTGSAHNVTVADGRAYVSRLYLGPGLQILDVTRPGNPLRLGVCPSIPTKAVVAGHYAYVASEEGRQEAIRIYDVSVPTQPRQVSTLSAWMTAIDLAVAGDRLYAISNGGLWIADVSDPADPEWLVTPDVPGVPESLAIAEDLAYVACGDGLRIYDVADLAQIKELGFCGTPGTATRVVLADQTAYFAAGDMGLFIIDVADPARPVLLATVDTPGSVESVAVRDHLAYVADGSSNTLRVVDVTDPRRPVEMDYADTVGPALGVDAVGDLVYVAASDEGLLIYRYVPLTRFYLPMILDAAQATGA